MNARAVRSQCSNKSSQASGNPRNLPATTLQASSKQLNGSFGQNAGSNESSQKNSTGPSLPLPGCTMPVMVVKEVSPPFGSAVADALESLGGDSSRPASRRVLPSSNCDNLHPSLYYKKKLSSENDDKRPAILETIVEVATVNYYHSGVDASLLPASHPTLARMLLGYDALQRRRDTNFNRVREAGNGLSPTRVFVESNTLDIYEYWFALRAEIEWVAEMLSSFDGYAQLSSEDKATLFKNFWILFIILERSFDSYRVCGVDLDDRRMVSRGSQNDIRSSLAESGFQIQTKSLPSTKASQNYLGSFTFSALQYTSIIAKIPIVAKILLGL